MTMNWQRSYKITIGVPQETITTITAKKVGYGTVLSKIPANETESSTTIPAGNIIQLTNLVSEGDSIRSMKFTFSSKRKVSATAANSEKSILSLFNVNKETLAVINQDKCRVIVEAGYNGNVTLMYAGSVQVTNTHNQGLDVVTAITLKDLGDSLSNSRISVSFDENMSVADIIESIVATIPEVTVGNMALEKFTNKFYTGGLSYMGNTLRILENICAQNDLVYSVFNGVITVRENQLIHGTPSYMKIDKNLLKLTDEVIKTIDPSMDNKGKKSEQKNTKRGCSVSTFLIPIDINQFFNIKTSSSSELDGTYKITHHTILLDSTAGPWDISLRGEPM